MAKWWNDHSFGKELYLGQALFRSTGGTANVFANPNEISDQISILRKFENVGGFALYSASHLARLSDVILNQLYTKLLPTKVNTPHNTRPFTIIAEVPPQQSPDQVVETSPDEKGPVDKSAILVYKPKINKELPVPEEFSVTKSRKGWVISWKTPPSVHDKGLRYSVVIFEPVKGGDTLKTVFKTTEIKEVFIPRKSTINPAKVRFGIVSVSGNGDQSLFPKLFKVRGRRIKYN